MEQRVVVVKLRDFVTLASNCDVTEIITKLRKIFHSTFLSKPVYKSFRTYSIFLHASVFQQEFVSKILAHLDCPNLQYVSHKENIQCLLGEGRCEDYEYVLLVMTFRKTALNIFIFLLT